jgi:topoisomerase IV subunit A
MVTKKRTKVSGSLVPAADNHVKSEALRDFGKRNMTTYAVAVNLDRSVPDMYDGLKPVQRRILWALSQMGQGVQKAGEAVGVVLGRFHPHGDLSVYGAMVTMVHLPTPAIFGQGNWGNMTDGAAAYRYTNCMLTNYGRSMFESEYIHKEVTSFVPNYNDKYIEPVTLPAQLPNVLLNGGEGIGVGITTHLPTFTPESIIDVLERLLQGEKLQSLDFAKALKFNHKWGGHIVNTKENKAQWLEMFRGSTASVQFESNIVVDRDRKSITIDDWPPGTNLESFVTKVRAMPETQRCVNSKGSSTYSIECKSAYNYTQFDKFVEKVVGATRQRRSFKINVTKREAVTVDGITTFDTKFLALSVPQLIVAWLKERLHVETRSLTYRISKEESAIEYSKLMIYAVDKLDLIFKALRATDPDAMLVKLLKITPEQAKQILDLQVRKLSKLDQDALKAKLKEQQAHLKQLQVWLKKPKSKVLLDLARMRDFIAKDRSFQHKEDTQELTVV